MSPSCWIVLLSPAVLCSCLRVDGNTVQLLFSLEQNSFDCVKSKLSVVDCLPVSYTSRYFRLSLGLAPCRVLAVCLGHGCTSPDWHLSNWASAGALTQADWWMIRLKFNLGWWSEMGCFIFGFEGGWLCSMQVCVASCPRGASEGYWDCPGQLWLLPGYFPLRCWAGCNGSLCSGRLTSGEISAAWII